MTEFFLVRHGHNEWIPKGIAGRLSGVHLSETGLTQAAAVAAQLAGLGIRRIVSSPLERARETATPLADRLRLPVEVLEELVEVDFGDWNGRTFAELNQTVEWRHWNLFRSAARIPNGETMLEIQARMVRAIERLAAEHPAQKIALFSHGDPIRAVLLYWLGMPIDFVHRLEIDLGSISHLCLGPEAVLVRGFNCVPQRYNESS